MHVKQLSTELSLLLFAFYQSYTATQSRPDLNFDIPRHLKSKLHPSVYHRSCFLSLVRTSFSLVVSCFHFLPQVSNLYDPLYDRIHHAHSDWSTASRVHVNMWARKCRKCAVYIFVKGTQHSWWIMHDYQGTNYNGIWNSLPARNKSIKGAAVERIVINAVCTKTR